MISGSTLPDGRRSHRPETIDLNRNSARQKERERTCHNPIGSDIVLKSESALGYRSGGVKNGCVKAESLVYGTRGSTVSSPEASYFTKVATIQRS
jgi:hypothetical protein